jgi:hypothetical protein
MIKMKITILIMAIFVAGLVEREGYQRLATLLILIAAVEFWYESSPFRMHKQRIKHREKIKEGPSFADVLLERMGSISYFWIVFLAVLLVSGGVADTADTVAGELQSLSELLEVQGLPDINGLAGYIGILLWIALAFGAILTAIQLILGKERFDFD